LKKRSEEGKEGMMDSKESTREGNKGGLKGGRDNENV